MIGPIYEFMIEWFDWLQRPLYDNAWALLHAESASAEKLLSIDFKIQELAAREVINLMKDSFLGEINFGAALVSRNESPSLGGVR